MSFYGSKIILDHPNDFGQVPNVLDRSDSFWLVPNHFGQVQIIKISPEKSNFNLTKMIWSRPKRFGPNQNDLYQSKTIWTIQNHFGHTEGQGISILRMKGFTKGPFSLLLTAGWITWQVWHQRLWRIWFIFDEGFSTMGKHHHCSRYLRNQTRLQWGVETYAWKI